MDFRLVAFFFLLFGVFGALFQTRDREPLPAPERAGRGIALVTEATPVLPQKTPKAAPPTTSETPGANVPIVVTSDPCLWMKTPTPGGTQAQAANYLKDVAAGMSPADQDLLDWMFEIPNTKPRGEPSTARRFLEGLSEAGIFLGRGNTARVDVPKAIRILEEAQSGDPGNGAFDLFLASMYQRQGRGADALEAARRGLAKDRFDVYMTDISKKLLAAPSDSIGFLKAVQLFSVMPVPDMNPVREALLSLSRSPDYAPDVFRFAERIVDQATGSRTPYNHLDWWLSSYVMASHVLARRGQDIPRAFELNQEFNRFPDVSVLLDPDGRCNSNEVEVAIERFQNEIGATRRSAARSGNPSRNPN